MYQKGFDINMFFGNLLPVSGAQAAETEKSEWQQKKSSSMSVRSV
jgi:hypothetical protein